MEQPNVATLPIREAGCELVHQLVRHLHVIQGADDLAPRVEVTPLGECDQPLCHGADFLRLWLGCSAPDKSTGALSDN